MAGFDKWLYNFAKRRAAPSLKLTGESDTVGNTAVTVLLRDSEGHVILCSGTSVPTGADYAKGCLFIKTDVTTGSSGLYDNQGTKAAASFQVITGSTGITTDISELTSVITSGLDADSAANSTVNSEATSGVASGLLTDSATRSVATSQAASGTSRVTTLSTGVSTADSQVQSHATSATGRETTLSTAASAVDSQATSQVGSCTTRFTTESTAASAAVSAAISSVA